MFLESIDSLDVVLEGFKFLAICFLAVMVWRSGSKFPDLANTSWRMIQWGFVLMALGGFADLCDDLIDLRNLPAAAFAQTWIEEIGLTVGLILAAIGFNNWFHFLRRFLGLKPSK